MAEYDIQIEIDETSGEVVWTKEGTEYRYRVEELEDKELVRNLFVKDGAELTVYSQEGRYTIEEYLEVTGLDKYYTPEEYLIAIGNI